MVCFFDNFNRLLVKFGSTKERSFGSVTCIDVSFACNMLVAGHENGAISIWDIKEKKHIKHITDIHKDAVLSLKIWRTANLSIISSDAEGNINSTEIEKIMIYYNVKTKSLFKKSAGNVTSITVLNRHYWCSQLLSSQILQQTYVVIGSSIAVMIFCIDPTTEIVYRLLRPPHVRDNTVPSVTWGRSSYSCKENQKLKVCLLLAWDQYIYLIELVEKGDKANFQVIAHAHIEFEIHSCGWLAPNIIFLIDNKTLLHIIHTSELAPGDVKSSNPKAKIEDSESQAKHKLIEYVDSIKDAELLPQNYYKDAKGVSQEYYQNSVSYREGEIVILGKRGFFKVYLIKWKDYLANLLKEDQWLMFLTVAIEIFRGNLKEFGDIPVIEGDRKKSIIAEIDNLVPTYVEEKLLYEDESTHNRMCLVQSEQYRTEATLSIMDFCLEIGDYQLLFGDIKRIFVNLGLNEEFLKHLEPFIKLNKIKLLPDQVLREIVYFFSQKEKSKLMQQMILNLDFEKADILALQTLCLEINLNAALIHIVMDQEDVVIAFVKLINEYLRGAAKAENSEDTKKSGFQTLWLLKKCFKGRSSFSTKTLPEAKWKSILEKIVPAAFEKEYLKLLFEIEPNVTTNLILLLFTSEAERIIEQLSEEASREVTEGPKNDSITDMHVNLFVKVNECIANSFSSEQREKLDPYFGFLIAKIVRTGKFYFIDKALCARYRAYFLKNPKDLTNEMLIMNFKLSLPNSTPNGEAVNFIEEMKRTFTEDYVESEKNELVLALFKFVEPSSVEDLKMYIEMAKASSL